jgi:chromosome segregation ATPase
MEAVSEYADTKAQLEERIRNLEEERATLQGEIESLHERLTIKEMERDAASLENQVNALRGQKETLEAQLASFDSDKIEAQPPVEAG